MGIALILLGLPFYAYWSHRRSGSAIEGTAVE
jgi:cbb3-type cytochrome oxidase subunit 3